MNASGNSRVPNSPELPYQWLINNEQKTTPQERYWDGSGMEVFEKAPYLEIFPIFTGINSFF